MLTSLPKELLIATSNEGKFAEIASLLEKIKIKAISASDFNIEEPEENGHSFEENSLIKAKHYGTKAGIIALADDSGFCIKALDNGPGIHTARFAKNDLGITDFPYAFKKIFDELETKGLSVKDKLEAFFICNLAIFDPKTNFGISFEGRVDGHLSEPKGENGFGYDPIFIKDGMDLTFGEVTLRAKDRVSHRANAFEKLVNWLQCNKYNASQNT